MQGSDQRPSRLSRFRRGTTQLIWGVGAIKQERDGGREAKKPPTKYCSFQPKAVNCSGTNSLPEVQVWVYIYILHGSGHHSHMCLWHWGAAEANTSCRNKTAACGQRLFQLLQRTCSDHKVTFSQQLCSGQERKKPSGLLQCSRNLWSAVSCALRGWLGFSLWAEVPHFCSFNS